VKAEALTRAWSRWKQNRVWVLVAILFVSVAMVWAVRPRPIDPSYAGKPLAAWLDHGYEDAAMAIHHVGPAAADVIFAKLREEHPRHGRQARYHRLWSRAPGVVQRWLPAPRVGAFDELRACSMLIEIGPGAASALGRGTADRNAAVRWSSVWALGVLRERRVNVASAERWVDAARRDPDPNVRERADWFFRVASPDVRTE
jgi:hypothetical protein